MTKTTRITHEGLTYDVVTNEAERNSPLFAYCQVYRIRKDGKPGRKVLTTMIVYELLKIAEAQG
jgi:hypothetical protein